MRDHGRKHVRQLEILREHRSAVRLGLGVGARDVFADEHEILPADGPEFLSDIIFSPVYAWIPRFVWEDKPLANVGLWYTQVVFGLNILSSTAMGVITYLYFAGGTIMVFVGLFFIGVIQRAIFFFTQPWLTAAGAVVFFALLPTTVNIAELHFNSILVTLFREFPLMLALVAVCYRVKRRST